MTDCVPISPDNPAAEPPEHVVLLDNLSEDNIWVYMSEPCPECGFNYVTGRMRVTTLACAVTVKDEQGYKHCHEDINRFSAEVSCPKGHRVQVDQSRAACWCGWRRKLK